MSESVEVWTPIRVVNKHHLNGNFDGTQSIQRPTPLGNPWRIGRRIGNDNPRDEILVWYSSWLEDRLADKGGPVYRELIRLAQIDPLILMCSCKPLSCHGDLVAKVIDHLRKQGLPKRWCCPDHRSSCSEFPCCSACYMTGLEAF